MNSLHPTAQKVYEVIVRRFLAIFYPPAIYQKVGLVTGIGNERFYSNFKTLIEEGYLKVTRYSFSNRNMADKMKSAEATSNASKNSEDASEKQNGNDANEIDDTSCDAAFMAQLNTL